VSLFDVANIGDVLGFAKNIFVVFTNWLILTYLFFQ